MDTDQALTTPDQPIPKVPIHTPVPTNKADHSWTNDTGITSLTQANFNILQNGKQLAADSGDDTSGIPHYEEPTNLINDSSIINQRIRFNLIRHRGTNSSTPTVKLFKSFASTLRNIDSNLAILPYLSSKQHYSSLTNIKQINAVDDNRLHQYFKPFYQRQYYSLSGYFHISSSLTFDELSQSHALDEWLDSNRYYMRLCTSQDEEMIQLGALLYSNIFMYREDLKHAIQQHPLWNFSPDSKPPVFDINIGEFNAPNKRVKMLFVSGERSHQETLINIFKTMYDGAPKEYPNGAMMVFLPLTDGSQYSPEYRTKIVFNHEKFIGDEAAICIGGLHDLRNMIKLKSGHEVTIRTLLKSIPASQGMHRPQLFQFVEPNSSGIVTIATYQATDKIFIDKRKESIEAELRHLICPGEEIKLFINEDEGMWFGSVLKNKNGRILTSNQPNKAAIEYNNHVNSILHTPPKKRDAPKPDGTTLPKPANSTKLAYSIVAQHTKHHHNTTITPIPQANGAEDPRFRIIEQAFQHQQERNNQFDSRISNLEKSTNSIDNKVDRILEMMELGNQANKTRKVTPHTEHISTEIMGHPSHILGSPMQTGTPQP